MHMLLTLLFLISGGSYADQSNFSKVKEVFVSCTKFQPYKCLNVIDGLLPTKVTVNVFVQNQIEDQSFWPQLEKRVIEAKVEGTQLKLLRVDGKGSLSAFPRDMLILISKNNQKTILLPPLGYAEFSSQVAFLGALAQITDFDIVRGVPPASFGQSLLKLHSTQLKNEPLPDIRGHYSDEDRSVDASAQEENKGGNLLFLPGGGVAYGILRDTLAGYERPSAHWLEAVQSQGFKLYPISIPVTFVGHIDEVLNIVPASNECGMAILRASPLKMAEFIKTTKRAGNHLFTSFDPEESDYLEKRKVEKQMDQIRDALKTENDEDAKTELKQKMLKLYVERLKFERMPLPVKVHEFLADKNQAIWDQQSLEAAQELRKAVQLSTHQSCTIPIVDIPVLWTSNKELPLTPRAMSMAANPINGLYINGEYLISKPYVANGYFYDLMEDGYTLERTPLTVYDHAMEEFMVRELQKVIPRVRTIDTHIYDTYHGNLHCATNELRE